MIDIFTRENPVVAVVGGQWGDEGKGKVIDLLVGEGVDAVIRAQGGDNAGHSVVTDQGEFAFHGVPSGVLRPETKCIIGQGTALNPTGIINELDSLEDRGIDTGNVWISSEAHLIWPYHLLLDRHIEGLKDKDSIGTTGRGIGPAYSDKALRIGVRAEGLRDPDSLMEGIELAIDYHRRNFSGKDRRNPALNIKTYRKLAELVSSRLAHRVIDSTQMISELVSRGDRILVEGAQGAYLDIDSVFYPFVTSSSTTIAGVLQGASIAPRHLGEGIGVFKAIPTRVGGGPFPTEQINDDGDWFREEGGEFGTTTGRARRIGYMDLPLLRYSDKVNDYDSVFLAKLDLPQGKYVKVCEAYDLDGRRIEEVPDNPKDFARCKPIYMSHIFYLNQDLTGVIKLGELRDDNKYYMDMFAAQFRRARVMGVGKGRHRNDIIWN